MIRSKFASRPPAKPGFERVKTMTFLWALLALVVHVVPGAVEPARAQGSRKDDIVFNSRGIPLAGATVRVCAMPASGQPCTPLALIYSDPALTQALANPTTTDGLGNYFFYAAPGKYEIEISGPAITTKQIPNVILPNDPSSPSFNAVSAFSLTLSGNLTVNGNTTVVGNLASGTLNLTNQSTPPGAAGNGTVNLYAKTADKRLYYKDDTGTELGPLGAGAQTNAVNTFTANQNLDSGIHIKGPDPYNDMARYGGYFNNSPPSTTASCTNNSTSVTLASALDFLDASKFPATNIGNGIVLYQCGAPTALTTPPAPSVSPFGVTNGTTTYNYKYVAEDLQGGLTPASPAGTTTAGAAALGATSVTLTNAVWNNTLNGEQVYTCSTNCNVSVNAPIYISGFTGNVRFNGNFTVIATPSSTTFTVYSPSATTPSVTTDSSGGTMKVLACNILTMSSGAVPNTVEGSSSDTVMRWWVYRNNTLAFVVQARDPYYEDCGVNMDSTRIPGYLPSSPSAGGVNKYLATTIVSGGGTTSIVVANAAGNTISGQTALHDNSQNLLSVSAASRFSTPVYIPAGANPPFNAATVFTGSNANNVRILTSGLAINQPWVVRSAGLVIEGQRNNGTSFAFGQMAVITGSGSAYPVVLQLPFNNGSGSAGNQQTLTSVNYVNIEFNAPALQQIAFVNDQQFMFGLLMDNVSFVSSTSASNANIPAAVFKGPTHSVIGAPGNENSCSVSQVILAPPCIRFTTQSPAVTNGAVSLMAQSELNGWNMQGNGFQFDALPWTNSGGSISGVTGVFNVRMIKFLGEQRFGPFVRIASPIAISLVLKQVDDDAPNAGTGNGFIDTAAMGLSPLNLTAEDIASSVNGQVLVAGPALVTGRGVGLAVGTTMSGAVATPSGGVVSFGAGGISTAGAGTGIQAAGISSLGYAMPQPNAPTIALGAHGSCASNCVASGTYFYGIVANDVAGHNSVVSPASTSVTTDGTQTVTVSWLPVGGQVTTSRGRGTSANNILLADVIGSGVGGTSYTDTGGTAYTVSQPQSSSANSSSLGSPGLATPQIIYTNSGFSDTIGGTLSANRNQTIPDVTGYIPVSGYQNSAYDNATRANGAIGSNWTTQNNAINISGNQFVGTVASNNNVAFWSASSFAAPQFSELTITAYNGTTDFWGPSVLMSGTGGSAKSYNCIADTTNLFIQRTSGTVNTNLTSTSITGNPGDVIRLEVDVVGNLTCYLNGVVKLTFTDTTYTSGSPGMFVSGNVATAKNWGGGNLRPLAHLDSEQDWTKTQHFLGNGGTCTMSAGTTCTITLPEQPAGLVRCLVAVQGSTAIAGACSISGTTLTITAASSNSATWAAWVF